MDMGLRRHKVSGLAGVSVCLVGVQGMAGVGGYPQSCRQPASQPAGPVAR